MCGRGHSYWEGSVCLSLEMALWVYQIGPKLAHTLTSLPVPISWHGGKATQCVFWKQAFISCDTGESCVDECSKQEGFCLCNLAVLNIDIHMHGFTLLWPQKQLIVK